MLFSYVTQHSSHVNYYLNRSLLHRILLFGGIVMLMIPISNWRRSTLRNLHVDRDIKFTTEGQDNNTLAFLIRRPIAKPTLSELRFKSPIGTKTWCDSKAYSTSRNLSSLTLNLSLLKRTISPKLFESVASHRGRLIKPLSPRNPRHPQIAKVLQHPKGSLYYLMSRTYLKLSVGTFKK